MYALPLLQNSITSTDSSAEQTFFFYSEIFHVKVYYVIPAVYNI